MSLKSKINKIHKETTAAIHKLRRAKFTKTNIKPCLDGGMYFLSYLQCKVKHQRESEDKPCDCQSELLGRALSVGHPYVAKAALIHQGMDSTRPLWMYLRPRHY